MIRTLTAAALALTASAAHAETTLRVTLQLPLQSNLGENVLDFEKLVEERSDGELQVEIYPSAQLYKDKEVPQAVASGAIEMGVASLTRFAGTIPAVDIFYVPFMFNSEEMVRKAVAPDSPIRAKVEQAIAETGAHVLYWQAYGGAIMLSKDEPLKTPADVEGKKVRVFGKLLGEFVEALGGVPTLISGSEQFIAYQRGTVDAGMTGVVGVHSRKLDQVMDWVTVTNHADIEFVMLINEDVWQGLSEEHRQILSEAGLEVEGKLRDETAQLEAAAFDYAKEQGMGIYHPSEEEIAQWRAATAEVVDDFKAEGGPLADELVELAVRMREGS